MKRHWKKILFIFILILFLGEIGLRIFFSQELFIRESQEDLFIADSVVYYAYKPNADFIREGKKIQINSDGYIGKDFGEKSSDIFRIAIVGDCSVSGWTAYEKYFNYCSILDSLLEKTNKKVEILNCGVDGGERSLELFLSVEHKVIGFEPDMILLEYDLPFFTHHKRREFYRGYRISYPLTDLSAPIRLKKMVDNLYENDFWLKILSRSYLFRAPFNYYMHRASGEWVDYIILYRTKGLSGGNYPYIQYTLEESIEMVTSLKEKLVNKDITFFLYQYEKNPKVVDIAKEYKLPLISLSLHFTPEDYIYKDGHWNRNGYEKVANRFLEIFEKYGMIPDKYNIEL